MRILVIDDTGLNLDAARQTLTGHDVVCVDTYDEASKTIERATDYRAVDAEAARRGLVRPKQDADEEACKSYYAAMDKMREEMRPAAFDAVLCDLLMPAGRETQGPDGMEFVGQMMPVGFALALQAVLQDAKYAAVVTMTNHHNHPASAMLDRLDQAYWNDETSRSRFVINGARVGFFHAPTAPVQGTVCQVCSGDKTVTHQCDMCDETGCEMRWDPEPITQFSRKVPIQGTVCKRCNGSKINVDPCHYCRGSGNAMGKDWGKVLAVMLRESAVDAEK